MKTLLAAFTAASLIATPVLADEYHEHHEYREHHDRGQWVAPLLGGLIVGGIIGSHYRDDDRPPRTVYVAPRPVYVPTTVCENYYVRDAYGNYVVDQYGRAVIQQRCWQQ